MESALHLLDQVRARWVRLIQPSHWLAEVAAVVVRLSPATAERKVAALHALSLPIVDTRSVLLRACRLAMELDHHLFGTLYHAVAIEAGGLLVTADERYFNKAKQQGRIVRLEDYDVAR